MNQNTYTCSKCKLPKKKEVMAVKRAVYYKVGKGAGKFLRSRTVAWLCPPCLEQDEDYLSDPYKYQMEVQKNG